MSGRPDSEPPFARVAIAGLGLIGGSIALAVRELWPSVTLLGHDRPEIAGPAQRLCVIDRACAELAELADADLIVLAAPVTGILDLLAAIGEWGTRAVVTDVGSTKRAIMAAAWQADGLTFVGGHPMAGAVRSGLSEARADLFRDRPWLLVEGQAPPEAIDRVESFVRALGAAPQRVDAETHDRVMAYVSHLPQLLSVALMNVATDVVGDEGLGMAGPAFAAMTRLAASPIEMWGGILATNGDYIQDAIAHFCLRMPDRTTVDLQGWANEAFARARETRAATLPSDDRRR
jgi:prephenate dehydrogenase